jgi:serine protease Do
MLHVARVDDRQISFNEGTRVERPNGELVTLGPPVLGELDHVTPPGGWMPGGKVRQGVWPLKFAKGGAIDRKSYDLTAQAGREQSIRTQAGQFVAVRIEIEGWLEQGGGHLTARAPYRATVWVSPELRRPIRFEAKSRTTTFGGISSFMIDETAELVAIPRD